MKYLLSVLLFASIFIGCNNSVEVADDTGHGHDHGGISIIVFEDGMELFAEADQLVEGHEVDIKAHLSFLENYSPAKEGTLYVRVSFSDKIPAWDELKLEKPGIFTGSVLPAKLGECAIDFMYEENGLELYFTKKGLKVYSHDDELPEAPPHGDEAIFTKEQAWKTEFGLLPLKPKDFRKSFHTSGEICLNPASLVEIIAPAKGKLAFNGKKLIEGIHVKKGSVLFTILSTGLSHDNILIELNTARAEYEKSKANLERKKKLLEIDAVSKLVYEEAKSTYDQDEARYRLLQSQVSESGMVIKSPVSGYITEVLSSENGFTQTGMVLLKIVKEDGLLIKANVPSNLSGSIESITSANIRLPNNPDVRSIKDFGGELVSYGRTIDPQSGMIPVYFSIDQSGLISGSFAELWLLTEVAENQIIIPESSLIEEYGQYYVYVQEEGEAYEKRLVEVEEGDGLNFCVSGGLDFGEVIVSKGGMAIKIANTMGTPPVHSH